MKGPSASSPAAAHHSPGGAAGHPGPALSPSSDPISLPPLRCPSVPSLHVPTVRGRGGGTGYAPLARAVTGAIALRCPPRQQQRRQEPRARLHRQGRAYFGLSHVDICFRASYGRKKPYEVLISYIALGIPPFG